MASARRANPAPKYTLLTAKPIVSPKLTKTAMTPVTFIRRVKPLPAR